MSRHNDGCAGRNGAHTPGPWDYVPSNEHHGPYVTTEYGITVCDCYCMSNPSSLSVRNGGNSKPIHHMHEMADANARLIAAAPELLEALIQACGQLNVERVAASSRGEISRSTRIGECLKQVEAAIAKAEGRS